MLYDSYEGFNFLNPEIARTIETEMKFAWENQANYPYFYQWGELSVNDINDITWSMQKGMGVVEAIKYVTGPAVDQRTLDILEEEDMNVTYSCHSFDIQWYSPAGEDFHMDINAESFISDFVSQAENFDPDEHAEMWIECRGQRGVPSTIREILDDVDAIKEKLQRVAERINSLD